jgi:16S rRNA (uracil1498-N3)-methyltransferase
MSERFFSATPITTDRVKLEGAEAHHLSHVMRAVAGQQVTLFDGREAEFSAVVEKLERSSVELRIIERHEVDRELPFPLVVGVALPKGDRQKWLVEKVTELGVSTLVPLITDRSVAQPTAGALERLERAVIEATKQCGRNRLMQIAEPQAWAEWIADTQPRQQDISRRRLVAHPGGLATSALDLAAPRPTQMAIGPEGGLTDAEVATAQAAGWQIVDLGPRILRIETAAVALASAISCCGPPSYSQ